MLYASKRLPDWLQFDWLIDWLYRHCASSNKEIAFGICLALLGWKSFLRRLEVVCVMYSKTKATSSKLNYHCYINVLLIFMYFMYICYHWRNKRHIIPISIYPYISCGHYLIDHADTMMQLQNVIFSDSCACVFRCSKLIRMRLDAFSVTVYHRLRRKASICFRTPQSLALTL